jgi:hypothetical protein
MTVYTLHTLFSGDFKVLWKDDSGQDWIQRYTKEEVNSRFEEGDWYFTGEVTDFKNTSDKVKSDGGSSSYYELTITNKAGESIKCETGDVIRALVGNDFDFGNCVKALRRMYLATLGKGKEGTDIPYDCNKVRYFLSEIERVNK